MTRNVFENNESEWTIEQEEADCNQLQGAPHMVLPPLADGFKYELTQLPSGREAVVVTEDHKENSELERAFPDEIKTCGCSPYQGCKGCGKPDPGLDSLQARTLRHNG